MKHLKVQGVEIDPLPLVQSDDSVGLSTGSCDLTDWCARKNPCLQRGLCVSEWYSAFCDCSATLFEGRVCQFSVLKPSCEEHFLSGERESGVRRVDLDGTGSMGPIYAYCEMGVLVNGRKYGVSTVEHNLYPKTKVRSSRLSDLKKVPQYRGMNKAMLLTLVNSSYIARQHMTLNCYRAFLGLGKQTYFKSAHNVDFAMVGGTEEGACLCNEDNSCIDKRHKCNCDQRSGKWVSDSAYLEVKEQVPVTELTFLQEFGGEANITLGPLEAMGKATQSEDTIIMFTSEHSYIDLPGWRGGNLEFIFRTLKPSALLLYQHGQNSSYHDTQLVVELIKEHTIKISGTQPPLQVILNVSQGLSNGEWQFLKLEVSHGEMRASIAGVKKIVSMPEGGSSPGRLATRLYVGGKIDRRPDDVPGLVGCFGGLHYDGKTAALATIDNRDDVLPGCRSQCDSDPCQNGATCVEYWDDYRCTCANNYAQSGKNCENDINKNSIKFTNPASNLYFTNPATEVLGEDYRFSFRTTQSKALLLYVYDQYNNFVQADIEGDMFYWSYNSGYNIQRISVQVEGMTDGRWKQVAVQSEQAELVVDVDGQVARVSDNRMPLMAYTQVPFKENETVVPFRNLAGPEPGSWVYVGGVPERFVAFEGLKGCMRGMAIGDITLDLAGTGEGRDGFLPGCPSGCETDPCQNGGRCFDDIDFNDAYTCDCSKTQHAGKHCDEEVGLYFKGTSQLEQELRGASEDEPEKGLVERLELVFATSAHKTKESAIAFVRGRTGLSDYMLVRLIAGEVVRVGASVQVQDKTVSVEDTKHAADGRPHRVVLERNGAKVSLTVDNATVTSEIEDGVSVSHDKPGILDVGWVRKDNFRFQEYDNFTGDIWNVFFTSDSLGVVNARPLEAYAGYDDGNHGITSVGVLSPATQSLDGIQTGNMYRDSTDDVWSNGADEGTVEYPPWNPGKAQTLYLVDPEAESADEEGASPAVAFIVCGIALVFFLGLTGFLIMRQRRRKRAALSDTKGADEEEGLLLDKMGPGAGEDEEPIATAKLRQGPKRSKSSELNLDEDENEETPMLRGEAPLSETAPPGQADDQLDVERDPQEVDGDEDEPAPPVPPKNLGLAAELGAAGGIKDAETGSTLDSTVPVLPEATYNTKSSPSAEADNNYDTPIPTSPMSTQADSPLSDTSTPAQSTGEAPKDASAKSSNENQANLDAPAPEKPPRANDVNSRQEVDEDSGDDSQKDIKIEAEVYTPSTGAQSGTAASTNGNGSLSPSNKGSSVDPEDDDKIVEIDNEANSTGSKSKAGNASQGNKKGQNVSNNNSNKRKGRKKGSVK